MSNSNCLITGVVATLPTNLGQAFGNFTWNCPGQTITTIPATTYNIQGNLTIQNTGTGEFRVGDFINYVLGNFSQTGGTFRLGSATARTLKCKW